MPDTTETRDVVAQLRAEECVSSDKAADLIERLSKELQEAKEALIPAHIYDPENWEYTMPLEDRASLVEDCDIVPGELKRFATLAPGPDMWAANVVLDRDEDGYPSECEIRWFNSEAEARSVLSPKKESDNDA